MLNVVPRVSLAALAALACAVVVACGVEEGSLTGGGDGAGPPSGPVSSAALVSAALTSLDEVTLTFSEALQPPTGVDPTSFRLSRAQHVEAGTSWFKACDCAYDDHSVPCVNCLPDAFLDKSTCLNVAYDAYYTPYFCEEHTLDRDATYYAEVEPFEALSASSPTLLAAALKHAFPAGLCDGSGPPKLFLHYAGGDPSLVDAAGDALADVAPRFAQKGGVGHSIEPGAFPGAPIAVDTALLLGSICAPYACTDGVMNGDETDVDCGGQGCTPCADGLSCALDEDCASGWCGSDGACQARCETRADCPGGACVPALLAYSGLGYDLRSSCGASSCTDGVRGGDETGIDCGGSCAKCADDACTAGSECASERCVGGACAPRIAASLALGGGFDGFADRCAITDAGRALCWGLNLTGELGVAHGPYLAPVAHPTLASGVTSIAIGAEHACAVVDGDVLCWGANDVGELGDGTTQAHATPAPVPGLHDVASVVAGSGFSCALTTAGAVSCWGYWNDQAASLSPVQVAGLTSGVSAVAAYSGRTGACAIEAGGAVVCWDASTLPTPVAGLPAGVTALALGVAHTCAVTPTHVWCWGDNALGQLGNGMSNYPQVPVVVTNLAAGVRGIASGYAHTCAVTASNGLACWGNNDSGELGLGTTNMGSSSPKPIPALAGTVASVFAGTVGTCVITTEGRTLCWGAPLVGDGTPSLRNAPTPVLGF